MGVVCITSWRETFSQLYALKFRGVLQWKEKPGQWTCFWLNWYRVLAASRRVLTLCRHVETTFSYRVKFIVKEKKKMLLPFVGFEQQNRGFQGFFFLFRNQILKSWRGYKESHKILCSHNIIFGSINQIQITPL